MTVISLQAGKIYGSCGRIEQSQTYTGVQLSLFAYPMKFGEVNFKTDNTDVH